MKKLLLLALVGVAGVAHATPPAASWRQLPTGNGFGFTVFDADKKQVTQFLERPYKYLHPGSDPHGLGQLRRQLAYDVYFGVRAGTQGAWMRDVAQSDVGYVDQSGIVRSVGTVGSVTVESYFVAPYGLEANGLLMVVHATNTGTQATAVDVFANPNFRMGSAPDPDNPGTDGESLTWANGAARETGNGGGVMVYLPLAAPTALDCSGTGYTRVMNGQDLAGTPTSASGNDLTMSWQKSLGTLAPGADGWWGLLIGFDGLGDGDGLETELRRFAAGRDAKTLLSAVKGEWEAWRKPPPAGLSDDETRVWRQSEAVLRMAQVREPWLAAPKQKAHGMILAALPPGIWHIGWVRDQEYATMALLRMGHYAEARDALEFLLNAEGNRYMQYTQVPYRISVTRYFGDGQEESDWNQDGPNIEYDGWGLALWVARQYVEASGDTAWLDAMTHGGERVFDVWRDLVVEPLLYNTDADGLVTAENSIWESHWNNRKQYGYTQLAAARGLCDFSALAVKAGDPVAAERARRAAEKLQSSFRQRFVDGKNVVAGSREELASGSRYLDAAIIDGFNWEVVDPQLASSTLDALLMPSAMGGLRVQTGGLMRNDDAASSYDSNEWIFVDMRVSDALRRAGRAQDADAILGWVTSQARLNFDLLPELFNQFPSDGPVGAYAGAVPMVGFGAGAYVLHLLDRANAAPETHACAAPNPNVGPTDGGTTPGNQGGCGVTAHGPTAPTTPIALAALLVAAAFALARRRAR